MGPNMGDTELRISDIAGAAIGSLEYIPLTLYRAYGLALIIWVWSGDIDLKGCTSCPWGSLYDDKRSYDLISIDAKSIAKRAGELGVDMVFLHGGEPISKPWLPPLTRILKQHGVRLGVKVRVEMLEKRVDIPIESIDAVLIEIPPHISRDLFERILYSGMKSLFNREHLYIEMLFTDTRPEKQLIDLLAELNRSLERIPGNRQPIPVGLQAHSLTEPEILSLARVINRACSGVCYVIESSSKISPEEIRCPRCGTVVARRKEIIVVPVEPRSAECPRCGSRVFSLKPHIIKRSSPVLSPIYIER